MFCCALPPILRPNQALLAKNNVYKHVLMQLLARELAMPQSSSALSLGSTPYQACSSRNQKWKEPKKAHLDQALLVNLTTILIMDPILQLTYEVVE